MIAMSPNTKTLGSTARWTAAARTLDANHAHWHLPVIPVSKLDMAHNWFVTAQKEGLKVSAGHLGT